MLIIPICLRFYLYNEVYFNFDDWNFYVFSVVKVLLQEFENIFSEEMIRSG